METKEEQWKRLFPNYDAVADANRMFVLIDMERMVFCYKSTDTRMLGNLSHIEFAENETRVTEICEGSFLRLSDKQLNQLHLNTTGLDHKHLQRSTLVRLLCGLAEQLPICNYKAWEVMQQANYVSDTETEYYMFVPGQNRPRIQPEEYLPAPLRVIPGKTPTQYPALPDDAVRPTGSTSTREKPLSTMNNATWPSDGPWAKK